MSTLDPRDRRRLLADLGVTAWVARHASGAAPAAPVPPAARGTRGPEARTPAQPAPLTPPPADLPSVADLDWQALRATVAACTRCGLRAGCTQTVFGTGPARADWLVVGEAPGAEEDQRGEPFVGRAGRLLDRMLLGLGLAREQVFIANVVKCRPPDNRDPRPEEAATCLPYLRRQIALVQPRVILCVGRIATQNLLGSDQPIGRLRGRVHDFAGTPLVATYHPAYLLRTPGEKRKAWEDLKLARRAAAGGA